MYEKDDFDHLRADSGFSFAFWLNLKKIPGEERNIFFQWTEKAAFDIRVSIKDKMLTVLVRNEKGVECKIQSEKELVKNKWHFIVLRVEEHPDKNTDFDLFIDSNFDSESSLFEYRQSENVGVTCGKFKKVKGF